MNAKAGVMSAIMIAFIGVVMVAVLLPIIDDFTGIAINATNNASNIAYHPEMTIMLGILGILIVVGLVYNIVMEIQKPSQPQY